MITLTIPDTLYQRLETLAQYQNTSIEAAISGAVSHEIERYNTSAFFAERAREYNPSAFQAALAKIPNENPEEDDIFYPQQE